MKTQTPKPRARWKTFGYWARLGIFALFAGCMVISLGQIAFMHMATDANIRPVHSNVVLPEDFDANEVTFMGGDDLTLSGWYVMPENDTVIILLHGYDANRTQLLWHAQQLTDAGFGILLYDLRGHGESEGDQRSNGWRDIDDVVGAVEFLHDKTDVIGIYGFSVGGQIALRATAKMPEIQAVFVDGPSGTNASDVPPPVNIQEQFVFRLSFIGDRMLSDRTNTPIPQAVMEILPQIAPRPIFFVATGQHPMIPGGEARLVRPFYEITKDYAEWWEIPDTGHGGGWNKYPDDYASYMVEFFSQIVPD